MKKIHITVLITLFLSCSQVFGQSLEGLWISSHSRQISKKNILYKIDTVIRQSNLLLDFKDTHNVTLKIIGFDLIEGQYFLTDKKLTITTEGEKINGKIIDNRVVLIDKTDSLKTNEIFFERLKPSKLNMSQIPDSMYFDNSNWNIINNQYLFYSLLDFDFINKDNLIITGTNSETGFTHIGGYKIDSYKNHFFLGIFDKTQHGQLLFHFYDTKKDVFYGDTYKYTDFMTAAPPYIKVIFEKKKSLKEEQLRLIESKLSGTWNAVYKPIKINSEFSEYDSIRNQEIRISFDKNNIFKFVKSGVLIKKGKKKETKFVLSGKWTLSKNAKSIKLDLREIKMSNKYLTINKITDNVLDVFFTTKILGRDLSTTERIVLSK